jgi:hypothetical protein
MPDTDMRERAARGAALLDKTRPSWYEGVSVGALNMLNGDVCVLGQIYGLYETGLSMLFSSEFAYPPTYVGKRDLDSASNYYGFSAFDYPSNTVDGWRWDALTQAWRDLIAERRCRVLNLHLLSDPVDEKVSANA